MANQRWPADKNAQFIKEYQRNECLWDPKHPHYKSRAAREAAYKKIMDAMEMECVKDVVGKIRILRNTYNNETLKEKRSTSTNVLYISKIPWLSHLNFLKNIIDSNAWENTEKMLIEPQEERAGQIEVSSKTSTPQHVLKKNLPPPPPAKRKKKGLRAENNLKSTNDYEKDASDVFGESVAIQLKAMTEERALLAKCKIQTILTEYGIADLQEKKNSCRSSNRNFSSLPSASTRDTIHSYNSDYSVYESTSSPIGEYNDPLPHSQSPCFEDHPVSPSEGDVYDVYEPADSKEALAEVVANTYPDPKDILG